MGGGATRLPIPFRGGDALQPDLHVPGPGQRAGVDAITAFSSDGRIAAEKLRVLSDPKHAIPGYDAILLVASRHGRDEKFLAALKPLAGRIDVATMREANYQVDRATDKQTPEQAARWLAARIGP